MKLWNYSSFKLLSKSVLTYHKLVALRAFDRIFFVTFFICSQQIWRGAFMMPSCYMQMQSIEQSTEGKISVVVGLS